MKFGAYFLLSLTIYKIVFCEYRSTTTRNIRGRAIRFPGFIVLPALILSPTLSHNQNENTGTHINENVAINLTESILNNKIRGDNTDIEANFRQALDRGNDFKKDLRQIEVNETFTNIEDSNGNESTEEVEVTTQEITTLDPKDQNITTDFYQTTEFQAFYSDSHYNNTDINKLTITVKTPDSILHPPLKDEQWKNFTMSTNIDMLKENKTESEIRNSLNISEYPPANEPNSPIKGVYKDALYNNAEIDQLSITTNSYTNELALPLPQNDRWSNFSSLKKMLPPSNEFKPLAGLYYDGFLHRPVSKSAGFVPYNHYYFY